MVVNKRLNKLSLGLLKSGGRNSYGRICVYHRGGGHKRVYKKVDFYRNLHGIWGKIKRVEYDPNRTGKVFLIGYMNGYLSYVLGVNGLGVGDKIISYGGSGGRVFLGNCVTLDKVSKGMLVHNVELFKGSGGKIVRSAGNFAQVVKIFEKKGVLLKLKSGEKRLFPFDCKCVIGMVSNSKHREKVIGKAGVRRNKGWRPVVRGVAMNPIDHPHGGGEGKTSGGRPSVSRWGWLTKGVKTRNKKKVNRFIVNIKN